LFVHACCCHSLYLSKFVNNRKRYICFDCCMFCFVVQITFPRRKHNLIDSSLTKCFITSMLLWLFCILCVFLYCVSNLLNVFKVFSLHYWAQKCERRMGRFQVFTLISFILCVWESRCVNGSACILVYLPFLKGNQFMKTETWKFHHHFVK